MSRADYAPSDVTSAPLGGVIDAVDEESPAARAGLAPGETVTAVDAEPVADVLDFMWATDGPTTTLTIERPGAGPVDVTLARESGESWGIHFRDVLFGKVMTCRNSCAFCFMTQLPKGLRSSLYLRDDDYRLSFLQGNFVTLTNLSDADVARIAEQRLSPLHVSIHAVSPEVREALVCARDDHALERLDELLAEGIEAHVQIVLVPGVNDGDELDRTLTWLAEREGIASVGIVPLGYTRHQDRFTASYNDPIASAMVIQQVQRWQFAMRERDAVTWVHLADEFYLNARAPFPTTEWYDGFPQYENGIGLVRSFGDEAAGLIEELTRAIASLPADAESATIVTGVMAATTLAGALQACEAVGRVRLLVVPNAFFGGNVTVTGLLTEADLGPALTHDSRRLDHPTAYLLPDVVFNADGVTLDDATAQDIASRAGVDLRVVSSDVRGVLKGLRSVAEHPPIQPKE